MVSPDPTPHLEQFESYEHACRHFRWVIPKRINIASEICRRHRDAATRIALSDVKEGGINTYTFGGLDFLSDKFARALSESGIGQGDSVAVVLPPSAALAIAHLGALKAGAVVVPLSMVSGVAPIELALAAGGARALVIDESDWARVEALAQKLPSLNSYFVVSDLRPGARSPEVKNFWVEIDRASSEFDAVETDASSAAFIFYVDLQGEITGVVHSHRSAIAQLAAFELVTDVGSGSARGTSGDWSSPDVVMGLLYPLWWYGRSVVVGASAEDGVVQSARLNDFYGKPETGWILGRCERWFTTPSGAAGQAVPGRIIAIVDDGGNVLRPNEKGNIAVNRADLGLFIGYRNDPVRTKAAFIADWYLVGDSGYKDEDGSYFLSPGGGKP